MRKAPPSEKGENQPPRIQPEGTALSDGMSEPSPSLVALYTGLSERLGPELADALMAHLPPTPAAELATRSDTGRLEHDVSELVVSVRHLSGRVDHLSERVDNSVDRITQRLDDTVDRLSRRVDRLQYTTTAGFIALTTALIASGFLS